MKHRHFVKHQFIANYLAKFPNAYEILGIGKKNETHSLIANRLELTASSFALLRSEYDGFYENRKGLPEPYKRKSRVEHKEIYNDIDFETYSGLVKKIIENPEANLI